MSSIDKLIILLFLTISFCCQSQKDTIFKRGGSIIVCSITFVNDNNIFYNTKKTKGDYISLSEVKFYSQDGKRALRPLLQTKRNSQKTKDSLNIKDSAIIFVISEGNGQSSFKIKMNSREIHELKFGEIIKYTIFNDGELKIMITEMQAGDQISYNVINLNIEFPNTYYLFCSSLRNETKLIDEEIGKDMVQGKPITLIEEDLLNPIIRSNLYSTRKTGSGFLLSESGLVVTNQHVIDKAKKIELGGINGQLAVFYTAKVILEDKKNDLAIIQIENKDLKFSPIPYTFKNKNAETGESIFILGYPLIKSMGEEIKLTTGVISSKTGFKGDVTTYQVSAPVHPGNSGGPLFDKHGNLAGVINSKILNAEGVTYAIKISYLNSLIDLLPAQPTFAKSGNLDKLSLEEQVKLLSDYVFIIKVN